MRALSSPSASSSHRAAAATVLAAALTLGSCAGAPSIAAPDATIEPAEVLAELAGSDAAPFPGLAVSVVKNGETLYRAAFGVRKRGSPEKATLEDAFHIGSDTKAMTALLCGILVDRGLLAWGSTVGDVLGPDVPMRDEYRAVTLEQLLSHSSGLPAGLPLPAWLGFFPWNSAKGADRAGLVRAALALSPRRAPGTGFEYSNLGFVVAGRMAETVTGSDWETLLRKELFQPLGMTGAGFGPPAAPGEAVTAPWGHSPRPVAPDAQAADNPAALGPAGTVHATLADLERYLALYWRDGKTEDGRVLVSRSSLDAIQRPRLASYALGWGCGVSADGDRFITHDGSNTMFYCSLLVLPDKGDAIIVLANRGDGDVPRKIEGLVRYLAARFLGEG